jgi:hypothetical protein
VLKGLIACLIIPFWLLLKYCNLKLVTKKTERKIKNSIFCTVCTVWFKTPCFVCVLWQVKWIVNKSTQLSVLKTGYMFWLTLVAKFFNLVVWLTFYSFLILWCILNCAIVDNWQYLSFYYCMYYHWKRLHFVFVVRLITKTVSFEVLFYRKQKWRWHIL